MHKSNLANIMSLSVIIVEIPTSSLIKKNIMMHKRENKIIINCENMNKNF